MGYCPFEYWLNWTQGARGTGARARALGRQAGRRRRWGADVRGPRTCGARRRASVAGARGAREAGKLGRERQGVLLGQLAVQSVHAACF